MCSFFIDGRDDIAVELAYALKPGENPEQDIVYYLNENGGLEVVKNARYDEKTGKVVFRPQHFSSYAAAYAKVAFAELPTAEWAAGPIAALAARGGVTGVGDSRRRSVQPERNGHESGVRHHADRSFRSGWRTARPRPPSAT